MRRGGRPLKERIVRGSALAATALAFAGIVWAAYSTSKIGGVLTALLLAVIVAVIWTEGATGR